MQSGCILSRIDYHASTSPHSEAISSPGWSATYAEFDCLTDSLALTLQAAGIRCGDRILILGRRIAELPYAVIGILKAGGVFAIVDPSHPKERLVRMATAFAPAATIEFFEPQGALNDYLSAACKVRVRDWTKERFAELPSGGTGDPLRPQRFRTPAALTYAVFTSGTTGEPKVVGAPWGALANFLEWQWSQFALTPADRFPMFSGLGYDPLVRDLLAPLWCGGTLCVPAEQGVVAEGAFAWAKAERITAVHWTPSMCDIFAAGSASTLPDLRLAFFGGEPLRNRHVRSVRSFAPNACCVNVYGASETPQVMAYHIVEDELSAEDAPFPIGRPIDAATLDVTDSRREPSSPGEWGELRVSMRYLSHGYLNDPELSRQRFASAGTDCFSEYFTGDVARKRPDGLFEVAGRTDRQVKLRGQRIELAEIEHALAATAGVPATLAAIKSDPDGEDALVGYVLGDPANADAQAVRTSLAGILPAGMVPSEIIWLREWPLTPSGKIDLGLLPSSPPTDCGNPAGEMSEEAEAVARIWSHMLKLDRIGSDDNFFMLGGFSMLAVRMLKRVQEQFAISLPISAILRWPTLSEFANEVARLRKSQG